jgi:hypothetical protein
MDPVTGRPTHKEAGRPGDGRTSICFAMQNLLHDEVDALQCQLYLTRHLLRDAACFEVPNLQCRIRNARFLSLHETFAAMY